MTYQEYINNIIETSGQHRKSQSNGVIYERHHIHPRCLGGSDDLWNLIDLTPREHYIAHQLLAQENPLNVKLVCAWHYMSVIKKTNYCVTDIEYQKSREAIIKAQGKAVYKLNDNGEILDFYNSGREAARANNLSNNHIAECCNKKRLTCGGYYWQYVDDYFNNGFHGIKKQDHHGYKVQVDQFSLTGTYLNTYESISEATKMTHIDGSSISANCRGKLKTSGGFIWKYHE